jgi:hypothetical protein
MITGGVLDIGSVALGDLDRDGRQDLVVTTNRGAGLALLRGDGRGGFGRPSRVGTAVKNPSTPLIGTVYGDSVPDLVVLEEGSPFVVVLLGRKNGGFEPLRRYRAVRERAASMTATRLSLSSSLDLIVTDPSRNDVSVLYGPPLLIPR